MATTLPALDSTTHVSSVTYLCTFAPTIAGPVMFSVPQPVQFLFTFDTGTTQPDPAVDLFDVVTDSSWFDQSAVEASIKTALGTISAAIGALLSATQAAVDATVTIRRSWRISPNQTGTAAPVQIPASPVVYTEMLAYP